MPTQIDHDVMMYRAGNWPWTPLTGIVQGWALVCKVIRVKAFRPVAQVGDLSSRIPVVSSQECYPMDQECGLGSPPSPPYIRILFSVNLAVAVIVYRPCEEPTANILSDFAGVLELIHQDLVGSRLAKLLTIVDTPAPLQWRHGTVKIKRLEILKLATLLSHSYSRRLPALG
jgi:hypothetical protein